MAYRRISDLVLLTSIDPADLFLISDVSESTSKKLQFSALVSSVATQLSGSLEASQVGNDSTVPGTTVKDALNELYGGGGAVSGFEPYQEIIALTSTHITQKYLTLLHTPFNLVHVRMELLQGEVQINKKAVSVASGALTPTFEMDANLRTRLYFDNCPVTDGNEAHTGLSGGYIEGDVLVVSYLYKTA